MSDTAQTLIDHMVATGGWPEPGLLQSILEQGEAAVPPLLEVVHREATDWPEVETLRRACLLLGSLEATSAIPALIELFYRYDDDLLEDIYRALAMLGAEAVEPALAVVRDGLLGWYPRAMAANAAIEASSQEPALRARLTAALRELLAGYIARAETLDVEEIDMATSLVTDLARLADPEARALIDAATTCLIRAVTTSSKPSLLPLTCSSWSSTVCCPKIVATAGLEAWAAPRPWPSASSARCSSEVTCCSWPRSLMSTGVPCCQVLNWPANLSSTIA
jgi:hypothetical protein